LRQGGQFGRKEPENQYKTTKESTKPSGVIQQHRTERRINVIKYFLDKIKKNHALAMVLCCGIPIVGILALSSLGVLGSWGYYALILICPLGHVLMMRGMHSSHGESEVQPEIKQIEYSSEIKEN